MRLAIPAAGAANRRRAAVQRCPRRINCAQGGSTGPSAARAVPTRDAHPALDGPGAPVGQAAAVPLGGADRASALGRLGDLVAQARRAGQSVALVTVGERVPLAAGVDLAA